MNRLNGFEARLITDSDLGVILDISGETPHTRLQKEICPVGVNRSSGSACAAQ
jgi:hypothetical protein